MSQGRAQPIPIVVNFRCYTVQVRFQCSNHIRFASIALIDKSTSSSLTAVIARSLTVITLPTLFDTVRMCRRMETLVDLVFLNYLKFILYGEFNISMKRPFLEMILAITSYDKSQPMYT